MANAAPGRLQVVQDFINTLDLDDRSEQLAAPGDLSAWLEGRGLLPLPATATGADLAMARELREGLRALLYANNTGEADAVALECLDRCEDNLDVRLRVRLGGTRQLILEPDGEGIQRALGELLAIVFESMLEGTWANFKACASENCRWAFYDTTRNHSGRWCRMASCGNRSKVRTYRTRRSVS